MLSQRQRRSRWRMFLVLPVLVALIRHSELASVNTSVSTSSTSPSKKKSQEIGSLSDFTWQAWLLVDTNAGVDSSTVLRRITPKSIFIAPVAQTCASGYHLDRSNRCVKNVEIDEESHFRFLLEQLNAVYGSGKLPSANNHKAGGKQQSPSGPLQVNIPLVLNSKPQADSENTQSNTQFQEPINSPIIMTTIADATDSNDKKTEPRDTIEYEVRNFTKLKDASPFFPEQSDEEFHEVLRIADFDEETNDTSFSEVVDYKIQNLKTLLNASSIKRLNVSEVEGEVDANKQDNSTEMSPTLVLLFSPTRIPSTPAPDPDYLERNDTVDGAIELKSNSSSNATKEITEEVTDTYKVSSLEELSKEDKHSRENETYAEDETALENTRLNESQGTEFFYDDGEEEYSYGTDAADEESAEGEGDEILKHGEAGITIPVRNIERNETTDGTEPVDIRDRIVISFNDSAPVDKDEGSDVSSVASIDGDVIVETTLLDMNTEKLQVTTTKSPRDVTTRAENKDERRNEDNSQESFNEKHISVSDIIFPKGTRGATSVGTNGRKPVEFTKIGTENRAENESNEELIAAPSSSESILYHPPESDVTDSRITFYGGHADVKENAPKESSKDPAVLSFDLRRPDSTNGFKHTSMTLDPIEDRVRFPDYPRLPSQNYVRFPSSQVNSIHSQGYKQHSHYPLDDGPYSSTSTKSSVPVRQKPDYRLTAPFWQQADRQQFERVPVPIVQRQQQLFNFWSKMPLAGDPNNYAESKVDSTTQTNHYDDYWNSYYNQFRRRSPLRRSGSYAKTSSQDVNNKVLTRKRRRTPARYH